MSKRWEIILDFQEEKLALNSEQILLIDLCVLCLFYFVAHIIRKKAWQRGCFGEMLWWAARTSNPVDAAKRSGSIPPPERFFISPFLIMITFHNKYQ